MNIPTAIIASRQAAPTIDRLAEMMGLPEAVVEARVFAATWTGELE